MTKIVSLVYPKTAEKPASKNRFREKLEQSRNRRPRQGSYRQWRAEQQKTT